MKKTVVRSEILNIKPYVPGKPIEEVERELGINNIIKLASNENPWGPSPLVHTAIVEQMNTVHMYPDSNAYHLKQALSDYLMFKQENIIIGNGSDEVIKMIAETYINPGDEVIIGQPTFSEYKFAAELMGGEIIQVPTTNFVFDLKAILDKVNDKTKLVFICNPNNPTGTIVSFHQVEHFLRQLPQHVMVVFDEAYYEYVDHPDYISAINYVTTNSNIIVLRTFSKIHGLAGLRIGYGISNPETISLLNRAREPFNVNTLAQKAALASLNDEEYILKCKQLNLLEKNWLYEKLTDMGLEFIQSETNFILIKLGMQGEQIYKKLLHLGIIVRPCDSFGLPDYIRVTVGTHQQNERFIDALTTLL